MPSVEFPEEGPGRVGRPELPDVLATDVEPAGEPELVSRLASARLFIGWTAGSVVTELGKGDVASSERIGARDESVTGSGGLLASWRTGSLSDLVSRERGAARNDHGLRGALRTGAGRGSSRGAGVRECSTSSVNRMGQLRAIHEWPDRRYTRPTWISAVSPNARLHRRIDSRASTQVLPRA